MPGLQCQRAPGGWYDGATQDAARAVAEDGAFADAGSHEPRAELSALMNNVAQVDDDTEDIVIFDSRMADLKRGADQRLPPEVSASMLRGDTLLARSEKQRGAVLRRVRKQAGLTQGDLGESVGLRQGTVSRLEAGEPAVQLRTLMSVLSALRLELVVRPRSQGAQPRSKISSDGTPTGAAASQRFPQRPGRNRGRRNRAGPGG